MTRTGPDNTLGLRGSPLKMLKRAFDIVFSLLLMTLLTFPLILVALAVRLTSKGPALHWSKRVGRDNVIYLMPKFRSMKIDTPQIATHLMTHPSNFLTPIGKFLRKSSLDELPQLYSVIKGDMSLVGPRPALFNQDDLVEMRTAKSIESLKPGVTGWAQVNGRDELPISVKVELDEYYLKNHNLIFDLKILIMTLIKVFRSDGVSH